MAYNPNQPRNPAGTSTGGEWMSDGSIAESAARQAAGLDPHAINDRNINDPRVLKKLKIPKKMYHVAERENVNSIMKYGLLANKSNQGEMAVDRGVYLTTDPEEIIFSGGGLGDLNFRDPVILEIDTKGLNLRIDPEYYSDDWLGGPLGYIESINQKEAMWAMYSPKDIVASHIKVLKGKRK